MSTFDATGNSAACGKSSYLIQVTYQFAEGSIVYSVAKAKKGIMEAIAIKKVRLVNTKKTSGQYVPLYVDTYNSLWNENMLCAESTAQQYAIDYLEKKRQDYIDGLMNCDIR